MASPRSGINSCLWVIPSEEWGSWGTCTLTPWELGLKAAPKGVSFQLFCPAPWSRAALRLHKSLPAQRCQYLQLEVYGEGITVDPDRSATGVQMETLFWELKEILLKPAYRKTQIECENNKRTEGDLKFVLLVFIFKIGVFQQDTRPLNPHYHKIASSSPFFWNFNSSKSCIQSPNVLM